MQAVLDEIIAKSETLTNDERRELIRRLQEQQNKKHLEQLESQPKSEYRKHPDPNIEWIKQNSHKYRGLHITLKDGELISTGRTTKEADLAAKAKGFTKTLWHYIPREDEEVWGGW